MKATVSCLGALLVALACGGAGLAQQPYSRPYYPAYGNSTQSPGARVPGFNGYTCSGGACGSSYGMFPPLPFNGLLPLNGLQSPRQYTSHPYARGPRDFFMYDLR